jgi:hypothetical protein
MYNISVISNFGLDINFKTEKFCEFYVDRIPNSPKKSIRFLWVLEPNEVSGFRKTAINNYQKFDVILTCDNEILNSCPNSKLFPYGTTWIKDFEFTEKKEYCVTTLIGGKQICSGHLLRQSIPKVIESITSIPVHLYNSVNNPYQKLDIFREMRSNLWKNELFYSQYHISIENVTFDNWFTEKLIDCFQTKTIPIYIGCDNISEFFDIRGIFHVRNLEEMVEVCNNLTPQTYQNMIEYVEINYQLSMKYHDFRERIENEVTNFINKI